MIKKLLDRLDMQLTRCKAFAGNYSLTKTYFDQTFGMVIMFVILHPETAEQVELLWNTHYRPEFEKIIYEG